MHWVSVRSFVFSCHAVGSRDRTVIKTYPTNSSPEIPIGAAQQAAAHGYVGTLRVSRYHGYNMNPQDHSGQTALHWATSLREAGTVNWLLSLPNTESGTSDCNGRTSLRYAGEGGCIEIAEMLLQLPSETLHRRTKVSRGR